MTAEGLRFRAWVLSWAFWGLAACAAAGLVAYRIEVHRAEMASGGRAWHLRYELCKRLSRPPRPYWQECLDRADDNEADLLAAGSAAFAAVTRRSLSNRGAGPGYAGRGAGASLWIRSGSRLAAASMSNWRPSRATKATVKVSGPRP